MSNNILHTLLSASQQVLGQLHRLASALNPQQYSAPLELLGGNTIGKHYRHIIEFYQCLLKSDGVVNYDKRKRDTELETNTEFTIAVIESIMGKLETFSDVYEGLEYETDFSTEGGNTIHVKTSFERELAYNIEHAVHHMAILQMVVKHYYTEIKLEEGFGVAASTQRYQQQANVHSNLSAPGAN